MGWVLGLVFGWVGLGVVCFGCWVFGFECGGFLGFGGFWSWGDLGFLILVFRLVNLGFWVGKWGWYNTGFRLGFWVFGFLGGWVGWVFWLGIWVRF